MAHDRPVFFRSQQRAGEYDRMKRNIIFRHKIPQLNLQRTS